MTVISTMLAMPAVAPVIVKSVSLAVAVFVSVKKVVWEASGLAFTSMVTPCGGMVEFMVTLNGKFGPGAGGSVAPLAGEVVILKLDSDAHGLLGGLFLQ